MLILIFFLLLILAYWIAEKIDEDFASVIVLIDIGVLIAMVIVSICLFNCTYRIDEEIKVYEFGIILVDTIEVDPHAERGFNFPFRIIIPKNLNNNPEMIYACNLPQDRSQECDTFDELIEKAKKSFSSIDPLLRYLCLEKGNIMIIPAVPRMRRLRPNFLGRGFFKNNFLNDEDIKFKDDLYKYKNLADQHKAMMEYAIKILRSNKIMVDDRLIICGYSEGSKFASHFSLLHPEMLKAVIGGGTGGAISMPVSELDGYEFVYPTGIADLDSFNMDDFKKISFFYWMGDTDKSDSAMPYFDTVYYTDENGKQQVLCDENNNPTPLIDENGKQVFKLDEWGNYTAKYSLFSDQEVNAINKALGTVTQERFKKQEKIYKDFGLNSEFHLYPGNHRTVFDNLDVITKDIDKFIEKELNTNNIKNR